MTATILGSKLAGAAHMAAPASPVSRPLTRVVAAGRRGELVTLPHLGQAWIELPGAVAWEELQIAVRNEFVAAKLELDITTSDLWELKRARHTLARAARDPADHAAAFGTLEEWGELDPDVVNACWTVFGDVRERLDPMASPLTAEERLGIELAIKKKDARLLRSYGTQKLSSYLASTDGPQSTSPPPSSSTTDS